MNVKFYLHLNQMKQRNIRVYASIYNPEEEASELLPIETDAEWRIIETILEEIQAEVKSNAASGQ